MALQLSARREAPVCEKSEPGARRGLLVKRLTLAVVILGLCYLTIVPLAFLIFETFVDEGSVGLDAFRRAYTGESQAGQMALTSLVFAAGSAIIALVVGALIAFVVTRTNVPFKGLIVGFSMVPLIIPGILYAVAWIFLADREIGLLNVALDKVIGVRPLNVFSLPGMTVVEGLHLMPIAMLLMIAAFRAMDPSLEEAAAMSGASRLATLRRITIPLLKPALAGSVLLMFIQALESFETPAILGVPSDNYVFTSRIYFTLRSYPIDFGAAGAYAFGLMTIAILGLMVATYFTRSGRSFQTISGKAFRASQIELSGRARRGVLLSLGTLLLLTVVLPLAILAYASMLEFYETPSGSALEKLSFSNYTQLWNSGGLGRALRNSVVLGVVAATVVVVLTSFGAWFVARSRSRGRLALDVLGFTPMVVPGMVLGLALIFVYLRVPLPIYGTLVIMMLAYCTKYIPYGMRFINSTMSQISVELEESASMSGATWLTTMRKVVLPLASGGMIAAWTYVLITSFRELSSTVLLYSPGNETLSILMWQEYEGGRLTSLAAVGVCVVLILTLIVTVATSLGSRVGLARSAKTFVDKENTHA